MLFNLYFKIELWHLYKSLLPSAKGLLMTHKCRGSILVLSISTSVEPNEEQKEMISGFQ